MLDKDISQRIAIARVFLIFGIIVIHVPPSLPLAELSQAPFDLIRGFFTHGLFRGSVPVLTMISGYLLFHSQIDQQFNQLIKKKSRSLLLPLILWNIPLLVVVFIIQQQGLMQHDFSAQLVPFDWLNWLNALTGLTGVTINYPLNFLRDLFVLALLAPIFGWFIRYQPKMGLILVMALFYSTWDGRLIYNNIMPINFYLGGMAAIYQWNVKRLDPYAIPAVILLAILCFAVAWFDFFEPRSFKTLSPFLIWPALALLCHSRVGHFLASLSPHSFFVFLSHGPILFAVAIVYGRFNHSLPFAVYWLLAPFVVFGIAVYSHKFLRHFFPTITRFILGGR
ncbi:MAG: acyltransferase [Pseudomonadota bacterium]